MSNNLITSAENDSKHNGLLVGLGGITALITAIGGLAGLITALHSAGLIGPKLPSTSSLPSPVKPQASSTISQEQSITPNTNMPSEFHFFYNHGGDGERGRHDWQRVDQNTWIERFPDGTENYIKVLGRAPVEGESGTVLRLSNMDYDYFIPDLGSQSMLLKIRTNGAAWRVLGEMQDVQ